MVEVLQFYYKHVMQFDILYLFIQQRRIKSCRNIYCICLFNKDESNLVEIYIVFGVRNDKDESNLVEGKLVQFTLLVIDDFTILMLMVLTFRKKGTQEGENKRRNGIQFRNLGF
eukprot:TRINITY_DN21752_c0_g1_i13.p7 TRINITY_DN21752_c0_g1~~TRINITY_DN21752_c0_g1_i13.p7  ORF type:complete len:114 (+),score=7.20 TRINITY_DN21752_c0_g1_i13:1461-1802(+)